MGGLGWAPAKLDLQKPSSQSRRDRAVATLEYIEGGLFQVDPPLCWQSTWPSMGLQEGALNWERVNPYPLKMLLMLVFWHKNLDLSQAGANHFPPQNKSSWDTRSVSYWSWQVPTPQGAAQRSVNFVSSQWGMTFFSVLRANSPRQPLLSPLWHPHAGWPRCYEQWQLLAAPCKGTNPVVTASK